MRSSWNPLSAVAAIAVLFTLSGKVDAKGPAYTDPAEAGIDFQIQGEYAGTIQTDEGDIGWGGQVIALGDGKFDLVGYKGGLPGAGWNRGDETLKFSGEMKDGKKAVFQTGENTVEVADGKLALVIGGTTIATLDKVERKSPTLGMKAPDGATVLFDGNSTDAWENGEIVHGNLLGATNVSTKEKLGDHTLHVEFRTPMMPKDRGQARGNSGVYMQGRYELQVLDSFGLEGKNNECGGIYTIAQPIVNMCLPPLSWQTYDIDFTAAKYEGDKKVKNARVTIKHNGVVIHDDLELPNGTPGYKPEGPGNESLFLQNHGDPVAFQNIWVVKK
ncbi:MAG TPA: DUF1080 domain-containing protein [Planctomycetaceae bacterium]|nr:DUF1080 domain-containing protein [Planctomycetaceae bacterium]